MSAPIVSTNPAAGTAIDAVHCWLKWSWEAELASRDPALTEDQRRDIQRISLDHLRTALDLHRTYCKGIPLFGWEELRTRAAEARAARRRAQP
jgi:hypothetical protein